METASAHGHRGYGPVIFSLQNTLAETQALSRLAVLRQAFAGKEVWGNVARRHLGYCPVSSISSIPGASSIFGSTPAFMPGVRIFTVLPGKSLESRLGSRVSGGKQEGTP